MVDHRGVWHFCERYKASAGGNVIIYFNPDESDYLEIVTFWVTSDFTNADDLLIEERDVNNNRMCLFGTITGTNDTLIGPSLMVLDDKTADNSNETGFPHRKEKIYYPNSFYVRGSSINADDTITIRLIAKFKEAIPTISLTNCAADAAFAANAYSTIIGV